MAVVRSAAAPRHRKAACCGNAAWAFVLQGVARSDPGLALRSSVCVGAVCSTAASCLCKAACALLASASERALWQHCKSMWKYKAPPLAFNLVGVLWQCILGICAAKGGTAGWCPFLQFRLVPCSRPLDGLRGIPSEVCHGEVRFSID